MAKKKLAIIVPYRDREAHLHTFIGHMWEFFLGKDIDYTIVVADQDDSLPFNYGKLSNAAFDHIKENFDYFAFHNVDLLPSSETCDYSYPAEPICLASDIDILGGTLPYPQYYGGVVVFNKIDFESVNGYSNEYWGWGYEDMDLLYRCGINSVGAYKYFDCGNHTIQEEFDPVSLRPVKRNYKENISYVTIRDSEYMFITPHDELSEITDYCFTISATVRPSGKFSDLQYQGAIVSRPGYDTKISYTSDHQFRAELWDENKKHYELLSFRKKPNEWYTVTLVFDDQSSSAYLYVNGVLEDSIVVKGELYLYHNKVPIFIGAATADDDKAIIERDSFIGDISSITMWDIPLSTSDIFRLYKGGVVDNTLNWVAEQPLVHIPVTRGFKHFIADEASMKFHASFVSNERGTYKVKQETIEKCTPMYLPLRKNGRYRALRHKYDDKIQDRFFFHDENIQENEKLYREVRNGDWNTHIDGLNSLKYKVFESPTDQKNLMWLKIKV